MFFSYVLKNAPLICIFGGKYVCKITVDKILAQSFHCSETKNKHVPLMFVLIFFNGVYYNILLIAKRTIRMKMSSQLPSHNINGTAYMFYLHTVITDVDHVVKTTMTLCIKYQLDRITIIHYYIH